MNSINGSLLVDKSLKEFNRLLASSEPAPGGGSIAALAGVLGSALAMMVINLTVGKKAYQALAAEEKEALAAALAKLERLNTELTELVDKDTEAFNLLITALKMPKDSEKEKEARAEAIRQASDRALAVPLRTAEQCLDLLRQQLAIVKYGNKNAISDLGVGALQAFAGLEGAALNVRINLQGIADQARRKEASDKIDAYLAAGKELKEKTLEGVNAIIGNTP
jgi:formiminotetrahydrofolate cyclodeaminase